MNELHGKVYKVNQNLYYQSWILFTLALTKKPNYDNKLTWQIYSLVSKEQAPCNTSPVPGSWKRQNFTESAHIILKRSRPYITNS